MKPKPYNPAKRKFCVNSAWKPGRRVRILDNTFGYGGKAGTITGIDANHVYVEIKLGKQLDPEGFGRKIDARDVVAYKPEHLRLIAKPTGNV